MSQPRPEVNSLVDLSYAGTEYLSRVEDFEGPTVWVAAPLGGTVEPPEPGSPLSLAWSAGIRGRYVAAAKLRSARRPTGRALHLWNLSLDGAPAVDQRRAYVRAGGGEPIQLTRTRARTLSGYVTDIGEGGLRCRFLSADLHLGEPVEVVATLGPDTLSADGWVLRTSDRAAATEVTLTFKLAEADAEMVRRYVIAQQILARRTAADAAF